MEPKQFSTSHEGFVNDVQYDFYGRRLATCATDRRIEVFDQNENGDWTSSSRWNSHKGQVHKLAWAHPQYGQILASCSADSVQIWEEQERLDTISANSPQTCWLPRSKLTDSRKDVRDIAFAPYHLGLRIATGSMDGLVRIYMAPDVSNLQAIILEKQFHAATTHVNCLAWNPSKFDPPSLVVGGYDSEDHSAHVRVWRLASERNDWERACDLDKLDYKVNDVAWAPNMGRSFHLIAVASQDQKLKVHTLKRQGSEEMKHESILLTSPRDEEREVLRVEWNVTGTMLVSSCREGGVQLWKSNFRGSWQEITTVPSPEENDDNEMAI